MKVSKVIMLAAFNTSGSGKSYIHVDGEKMYIINKRLGDMILSGDVESVEMEENGKLEPREEGGTEFTTYRPKASSIKEVSKIEKLEAKVDVAKRIVKLYDDNTELFDKAAEAADKMAALGDF